MSLVRCAFDEGLFEAAALPCAQALLQGDLAAFSAALGALAEGLSRRESAEVRGMLRILGEVRGDPNGLAELVDDLSGDPLLPVVAARLGTPAAQRALLLLGGLAAFEDLDDPTAAAKQALKTGCLPGLDARESALYALIPLCECCPTGEPEPAESVPAEARLVGAILGLPGADWEDLEPFSWRLRGGWIWYKET